MVLQHELERSKLAVADALQLTSAARAEANSLAEQVAVLEERRACDVEALKNTLEIAERERDEARGLVRDAKKLLEQA